MFRSHFVALFFVLLSAFGPRSALAEAPLLIENTLYSGNSFGTYVSLGETIILDRSAPAHMGCGGGFDSNVLQSINAPPVLRSGTIENIADGSFAGSTHTGRVSSSVESLNLLGGVITAGLVEAVGTVTREDGAYAVSDEGTGFVNLKVLGIPIENNPPPNTQLGLVGFGHVILNEQSSNTGANTAYIKIDMIHVFITLPNPLLEVGTEIVVASTTTRLRTAAGALGGVAYGTQLNLLNLGFWGPSAPQGMPCGGTNGAVFDNSIASFNLPPILTSGTVLNTAQGTVNLNFTSGELVSRVEGINLLNGLVTVGVVEARALVSTDGTTDDMATDGSFLNLQIAGFPEIDDEVPINTQLTIPGVGTLWLNREIRLPRRIINRMIELHVLENNPLGLPIGSRIQVGVASGRLF